MFKKIVVSIMLGVSLLFGSSINGVIDAPIVEAGQAGNITYDESSVYVIQNDDYGLEFNIAVNVQGRGNHIYHYTWKNGTGYFLISMDGYGADSMSIYGTGSVKRVFHAMFYKLRGYSCT